jgi:hypothetical protein
MQLNKLLFRASIQEEGGVRGSRNSISDQANHLEKVPDNRKFGAEHLRGSILANLLVPSHKN